MTDDPLHQSITQPCFVSFATQMDAFRESRLRDRLANVIDSFQDRCYPKSEEATFYPLSKVDSPKQ